MLNCEHVRNTLYQWHILNIFSNDDSTSFPNLRLNQSKDCSLLQFSYYYIFNVLLVLNINKYKAVGAQLGKENGLNFHIYHKDRKFMKNFTLMKPDTLTVVTSWDVWSRDQKVNTLETWQAGKPTGG